MKTITEHKTVKVGRYTFHVTQTFADDQMQADEFNYVLANYMADYYLKIFRKESAPSAASIPDNNHE